jgi:hypothetical protein
MWWVYTWCQVEVNSPWITPNSYSMNICSPLKPGNPVKSITVINSTLWDKGDFSTQVCEHLCEGLAPPLAPSQSQIIPGITGCYSVRCWLMLHKFNSNEYLLVSVSSSPEGHCQVSRNVPQEMYTVTFYVILSSWNSIPQSVLSDVLELILKCLL